MLKKSFNSLSLAFLFLVSFLLTFSSMVSGEEQHGGDIWFQDTKMLAPVLYSHEKHIEAGNKCEDCHDAIFKKKKGSSDVGNAMSMKVMKQGKFCGSCHDGVKAFKVGLMCKKCHIKSIEDVPKEESKLKDGPKGE